MKTTRASPSWLDAALLAFCVVLAGLSIYVRMNPALPPTVVEYGEHLEIVLIVSAACSASQQINGDFVKDLREEVTRRGQDVGLSTYIAGVSIDNSWEEGADFLGGLGSLDQVSSGRGWMNSTAIGLVHRDLPGPPVVPQIIVVRRLAALEGNVLTIEEDQLLVRKVGLDEIYRWQHQGFPLPIGMSQ